MMDNSTLRKSSSLYCAMRNLNRGEPLARPPSHLLRPTAWASTAEYATQEEGVISATSRDRAR